MLSTLGACWGRWVNSYLVEGQSVSEHSYPIVVRGKGQVAAIQQPHTCNGIPASPSDHRTVCERWWNLPNTNKIDRDWGAERALIASCKLTSKCVRPLVKAICKRDLFFVILGQEPNLGIVFQLPSRWSFNLVRHTLNKKPAKARAV